MASQVFSGTGNFSYTNNTGGTVRVIINLITFEYNDTGGTGTLNISWGNPSAPAGKSINEVKAIGKNLAATDGIRETRTIDFSTYDVYKISSNNLNIRYSVRGVHFVPIPDVNSRVGDFSFVSAPTEVFINNGEFFAITSGNFSGSLPIAGYNILIVPENG